MASLRDLGLSEYEERAYRALLNTGPTTAKELSRASDVPMGRIYDVLNSIEQYNLVRSQTASRPKKYIAVEPDTALDRLLEDKKRELHEQAEQYEQIVDELGAELEAADPVEEQFWTATVGEAESLDLLLERIAAADDRVVMLAAERAPAFDVGEVGGQVTDALAEALDRGVTVQVLMSPALVEALPRAVGRRYTEDLQSRPEWTVKTGDVSGNVTLVDDAEVLVQVPNPLDPEEPFALIDLKDPEFAADAEAAFRPAWEAAEELRFE
jgi:sugar-specific transcriptional regulator TrmB